MRAKSFLSLLAALTLITSTTTSFHTPQPTMRQRKKASAPNQAPTPPSGASPTALSASPSPLITSAKVFGSVNAAGLLISVLTGSHVHLDLLGTGAFIPATLIPFMRLARSPKPLSASLMGSQLIITAWAFRLATFLFYRAMVLKHDGRLTETLSTFNGTFGFWYLSALWGIFCTLPHVLAMYPSSLIVKKISAPSSVFAAISSFGFIISLAGLFIEAIADFQKWNFKMTHPNDQFISSGLWSISQHPNYFGNLLIFFGLFLQNSQALCTAPWRLAAGLLAPLFMYGLFYAQCTGLVADAAGIGIGKYGPSYELWMKSTPLIFPRFKKFW